MYHGIFSLACLVALLPFMSARTTRGTTTEEPEESGEERDTDPPRCFLTDQFTISKGTTTGIVYEGAGLSVLEEQHQAYDFNNSRIAAHIIRRFINGHPEEYIQVIENTEVGKVWVINHNKKTCSEEIAAEYPFHLIQNTTEQLHYFEYFGSSYLGDMGFYTYSYGLLIPPYYPTHGFTTFSHGEDCIPISDSFAGVSVGWGVTQDIVSSSGYYNYAEGIEDPDKYFTVPDFCTEKSRKNGGPVRPGRPGRPDRPDRPRPRKQ